MKVLKLYVLLSGMFLLAGCATTQQPSVPLKSDFWSDSNHQVGVYVKSIDKPELYMEGDVRLLDYAINAAAMSTVTEHFESLDVSDYETLRSDIYKRLVEEGMHAVVLRDEMTIDDMPGFEDPDKDDTVYYAEKDYSAFKKKYGIDKLIVVVPKRVGLARPYYGFVPTGDPRAVFELHGELIDLGTNQLIWYTDVSEENYASGAWDEPPKYPGLTDRFYASLEKAKQDVMNHLQKKEVVSKNQNSQ